ncbi:chorismate mutase [Tuwongella immobilis]|uniref:chorismate mutase n=1 Tax=Tuwongella immobilis TaxID=692036 RepID=A0A6C2YUZ2_9BACT|nr:chorismate mutase [Tuwongella immobilis]VIP05430.1 chorismate mutase : Chorismate mutase OS=Acinetobacter baumannii 99063 GN=J529_3579 PE=4 SV=1: CM_2 [Tuwongella immobilis]VTS08216.1 chorismate mutase : Chorismate mutase OS=Acinetobacter baumannii 99063 GN=J529_3579 PE=4 SV=1: CM_2 [Tuwongella immobilis]
MPAELHGWNRRVMPGMVAILLACIPCGCQPTTATDPTPPRGIGTTPETGPAATTPSAIAPQAAAENLLRLMGERLRWMAQVAAWKKQQGTPVDDPAREKVLLLRIEGLAAQYDLAPEMAREFMAAQIEAAKSLQRAYLAGDLPWPESAAQPTPLLQIRDALDALNPALLNAVSVWQRFSPEQCREVDVATIADKIWPEIAHAPTRKLALAPLLR